MTLLKVFACIEDGDTVEQATRRLGVKRQYFYFWIRRLLSVNCELYGLQDYFKRPHNSPNATNEEVIKLASRNPPYGWLGWPQK